MPLTEADFRRAVLTAAAEACRRYGFHEATEILIAEARRPAPGQRSVETTEALARRDALIRDCVSIHYGEHSDSAAAELLQVDLARYAASAWRHERDADKVPDHRRSKPSGYFWRILQIDEHVLSARQIRRVLATS